MKLPEHFMDEAAVREIATSGETGVGRAYQYAFSTLAAKENAVLKRKAKKFTDSELRWQLGFIAGLERREELEAEAKRLERTLLTQEEGS